MRRHGDDRQLAASLVSRVIRRGGPSMQYVEILSAEPNDEAIKNADKKANHVRWLWSATPQRLDADKSTFTLTLWRSALVPATDCVISTS